MTRCYEFYCMAKDCTDDRNRTCEWRINTYMKMMIDNGVLFNKAPEDKTLFLKLQQNYGTESKYIKVVTQKKQEPIITPPEGLYSVIVVDPPWPCDDDVVLGTTHHYQPMKLEEIAALKIPAADDCVLWLWSLNHMMHDTYHVLDAWGFTPKSLLTWVKNRIGTGFWLRGITEQCILAVKGSPQWSNTTASTVLHADIREHSRKPDEFYQVVGKICVGKRLDMFSREKREGWDQWGNEVDKF